MLPTSRVFLNSAALHTSCIHSVHLQSCCFSLNASIMRACWQHTQVLFQRKYIYLFSFLSLPSIKFQVGIPDGLALEGGRRGAELPSHLAEALGCLLPARLSRACSRSSGRVALRAAAWVQRFPVLWSSCFLPTM